VMNIQFCIFCGSLARVASYSPTPKKETLF